MITKNNKKKIMEYFLLNPTIRMRIREIERKTKTALPSVIRYTKELEKEGILRIQKISNVTLFSADRGSKAFLLEKKLFNLKKLFASGLIEHLTAKFDNPQIVLFGSYSKGEDVEDSDIDLYIESQMKGKIELKKFEKKLNRRIQIFTYPSISVIRNKNLANNIINGITLHGFVEAFK